MTAKTVLLSSAIAALITGSALAADLSSLKGPPYTPPPPPPMWTGFYFGVNAGGVWAEGDALTRGAVGIASDPLFGTNGAAFGVSANGIVPQTSSGGFMGGGQIGYNWQFADYVVIGVEVDLQGFASDLGRGKFAGVAFDPVSGASPTTVITSTRKFDYFATTRGRLGFLVMPSLLVYGTGGLAYGGVNLSVGYSSVDAAGLYASGSGPATFSDLRIGWTAGGGVEWMVWPDWSIKAEYLYYDLGTVATNVTVSDANSLWAYEASVSGAFKGQLARAGVNYHFNLSPPAPVLARY